MRAFRRSMALLGGTLALLHPRPGPPEDPVGSILTQIRTRHDDVEETLFGELAREGSAAAMQALVEAYGEMGSIHMRREVLRSIARFAGEEQAAEPGLALLEQAAIANEEPELVQAAFEGLSRAPSGRQRLARIVQARAPASVRVQALRAHSSVALEGDGGDADFYRALLKRPEPAEDAPGAEAGGVPLPLLRVAALEHMAPSLAEEELVALVEDFDKKDSEQGVHVLRAMALDELGGRGAKSTVRLARKVYSNREEVPQNRAAAARVLARLEGQAALDELIEDGLKAQTPSQLRLELAGIVAEGADDSRLRKLVKYVGRGKPHELRFALGALRELEDEKLEKGLRALLEESDPDIRIQGATALSIRAGASAVEPLLAMLEACDDGPTLAAGIEAISSLPLAEGGGDWLERLALYCEDEREVVRNAALVALGRIGGTGQLEVLSRGLSHESWTTRLAALRAIESLREVESVALLVARMGRENGRMREEMAGALWRLTGEPHRQSAQTWERWWRDHQAAFEVPSASFVAEREAQLEERRLRAITRGPNAQKESGAAEKEVEFFGVQVRSQDVLFILDISGSMDERLSVGADGGEGRKRIEVAQEELARSIDALAPDSHFNVLAFADGVQWWIHGDVGDAGEESKAEAKKWVSRLGALGGTNLYGALEAAFDDGSMDTICLLSDGDPSVGVVIDSWEIRERVKAWNGNRRVLIHAIALGSSLQILRWLTEDSGGTYVQIW